MAYTYGAFTPASNAAYSVWGSTGAANPYYTTPNVYDPIVPEQPVAQLPANVAAVLPGGDSSWVDPQTGTYTPLNLNFDSLGINPGAIGGSVLLGPLGGLLGGLGYNYFFGEQEAAPIVDKSYGYDQMTDTSGYSESTFDDWGGSGWDSYSDFQDDTGIGTSEWDSSHEDFSWD